MIATIRAFLTENFLMLEPGIEIDENASLLNEGIIDSTGVLELVAFVEETFGIKVDDVEIAPDNFDSIARIAIYVQSKQERAGATSA